MSDDLDYELLKTDALPDSASPVRPPVTLARILLGTALAIAAALVAAYVFYFGRIVPGPAKPIATAVETARPAPRPLGGEPEKVDVPPLDESDSIVRELVRRITSHPAALAWLTTNGLIRNFTVVVANVVDGATPARHLRVLRPAAPFAVVERDGGLFTDPRSYERYDAIAEAVASIDPAGGARLYATLKPRIEEAFGQLGFAPGSFDAALEKAIVSLLRTPAVDGRLQAAPNGLVYRFVDPNLEQLTAAQKQLLRTGPRNTQRIQSALRRLAIALGIPTERLS
jgi:hypothetical protein